MRNKCITSAQKCKNINNTHDLISIVLLCDSPGYRMKSYGPISLISIENKKLIDIQIESIKNVFKNFEIILCLGFGTEKVYKYIKSHYKNLNIRIVENQYYNSSNSCESLRLCLNNISNNKILICDGSILINSESLSLIDLSDSITIIEKYPHPTLEIGINSDNNTVEHFSFGGRDIWSEIFFLKGVSIINQLKKILVSYDNKNRFVFEALNDLINSDYKIATKINHKQLIKINNIKTYHKIK